jgi:hypothetical protein
MKATEQSIFLDKPETLETVSFRTTVWKDPDGPAAALQKHLTTANLKRSTPGKK